MSAALRQALRQVQQEAPLLSRSVRTSAGPRYHYVSATCKTGCHQLCSCSICSFLSSRTVSFNNMCSPDWARAVPSGRILLLHCLLLLLWLGCRTMSTAPTT